ncbi:MAG TPA: glycine betaine ABC transporter substrate-binding protein [Paenibacillaceae bacterium]
MKKRFCAAVTVILALSITLSGCRVNFPGPNEPLPSVQHEKKGTLTIGAKFFTEQFLLLKITSIYLKEMGYEIKETSNMESLVVRKAMENGFIDLYWEYTGTALVNYLGEKSEADPEKAFEIVRSRDMENGIVWLPQSELNNTFSLMMSKAEADKYGIRSLSDLAASVRQNPEAFKIATTKEFFERDDGLRGMEEKYGFSFLNSHIIQMDAGLTHIAMKEGQVNVALVFSTDAIQYESRLNGQYIPLEDDLRYFPAYRAAPVVRLPVLQQYPELDGLLAKIRERIDTETMMELIYLVDVKHKDVSEVARDWLQKEKLIE